MCSGSRITKAGFVGESLPRVIHPTVIGYPKSDQVMHDERLDPFYLGSVALEKRGVLRLSFPIENGSVLRWEELIEIWRETFRLLQVHPKDHPVIVLIPESTSAEEHSRIQSTLLEFFQVPGVSFCFDSLLCLNATGRKTGIVIDAGSGFTRLVPILENRIFHEACLRFPYGGFLVDEFLARLCRESGAYVFQSSSEREILQGIKRAYCFVAEDISRAMAAPGCPVLITLPDEKSITIDRERFCAMEPFFDPKMCGLEEKGLHHQVLLTVLKCPPEIRRELLNNIVFVGGTSLCKNFASRLGSSIVCLAPPGTVVDICAPDNRQILSWIGASTLFASHPPNWKTK